MSIDPLRYLEGLTRMIELDEDYQLKHGVGHARRAFESKIEAPV